jgi:hypothetical protein
MDPYQHIRLRVEFGVSSFFWDFVFRTLAESKGKPDYEVLRRDERPGL